MKKIVLLSISFIVFIFSLPAQSPAKYWVEFKDKEGTNYSIERPDEFLSPRAIEKRKKYHIEITEEDLPVSQRYINQIKALDKDLIVVTKSKWLNGITVYSEKEEILEEIQKLKSVAFCEKTITMKEPEKAPENAYYYPYHAKPVGESAIKGNTLNYGKSYLQIRLNNAQWIHRMGFKGEGILMMIMDGGFQNTDTLRYFSVLREENRLIGARNIVQPGVSPFKKGSHGTNVLSCIASYVPGELVGTAPMVTVFLALTEDGRSENIIEEDNWVIGVELADSLGVDVLNSSLGYTKFDDSTKVRTYQDLTGKVSRASRAATIAATKGIIVCNSAGNEGNKKWKHIGSPADAKDIIAVGAVDVFGKKAPFSSFGPTADGRIKPDACAVGRNTYVASPRSVTQQADGTSFSSPVLSGMIACLWQAFPEKTNYEIMDVIRKSGSLATRPNDSIGYGITDFMRAYNMLSQANSPRNHNANNTIHFDSFVSNTDHIPVRISSLQNNEITINTRSRSNGNSSSKKYKLKKGANTLKIKLPKLAKGAAYDFVEIEITGNGIEYTCLIGLEKREGK